MSKNKGNYEPGTPEARKREVKNIIQMNPLTWDKKEKYRQDAEDRLLEAIFGKKANGVRPSVERYSRGMESRLREKDKERGKDSWHDRHLPYYIERAMVCLYTIAQKLKTGKDSKDYIGMELIEKLKEDDIHFLLKKCIDGGNFLMMLADNLSDELVKRGIPQNGKEKR